jgi:serine/threonine protein kinase
MREDVLSTIRDALGSAFEILGEMGRDGDQAVAFLARENNTGGLVALKVEKEQVHRQDAELSLSIRRALDGTVPAHEETCVFCGSMMKSWARFCPNCTRDQAARGQNDEMLWAARQRIPPDRLELLGKMPRAEGGRPVFFGRRHDTGEIVALRMDGESDTSYAAAGVAELPETDSYDAEPETYVSELVTIEMPAYDPESFESEVEDFEEPEYTEEEELAAEPQGLTPEFAPDATISSVPMSHTFASPPAHASFASDELIHFCPSCGTEYEAGVWFCPRDGSSVKPRFTGPDLIGQVIADRYRVIRKIGEGGMGQVYYAEHVRINKPCALKIMNPALKGDPEAMGRFGREASHASRIDHPHVATVHDFGETEDGLIFIAMDYADGDRLTDMLARERSFAPDRAIEIARQIADALAAAHENGIVHRDLKPDNVIIARRSGRDFAKVVDFGIAKALEAGGSQRLTRAGFVVGTPRYMSPEQLIGDPVDTRSDIYSLGCILFEMLVGNPVFGGATGEVRITKRLSEPPPSPRGENPRISEELDLIVRRALGRAPEDRYQTAADMQHALAMELVASINDGEPARGVHYAPVMYEDDTGRWEDDSGRWEDNSGRWEVEDILPQTFTHPRTIPWFVAGGLATLIAIAVVASRSNRVPSADIPNPVANKAATDQPGVEPPVRLEETTGNGGAERGRGDERARADARRESSNEAQRAAPRERQRAAASEPRATSREQQRVAAADQPRRASAPPARDTRRSSESDRAARPPSRTAGRTAERTPERTSTASRSSPSPSRPTLPDPAPANVRPETTRMVFPPPPPTPPAPTASSVDGVRGLIAEGVRYREAGNYASAFGVFRTATTRVEDMRRAFPVSPITATLYRELVAQIRTTVDACEAFREVRRNLGLTPPECSTERR